MAIIRSRNVCPGSLSRLGGDPDDDRICDHGGSPGHGAPVAACLTHHRGRLAGYGRLVDQGGALHHLAVARDDLALPHQDEIAGPEV